VNSLEEKKAEDIVLIDLQKVSDFTDYFIISSGSSDRMLRSLSHAVLDEAKLKYGISGRIEGVESSGWIAIDMNDIVIHLFSPDQRRFYQLEDLWQNGKLVLHIK
jgi:ribosome-associated protein